MVDSFGNEITDENSIRQEYKNEFKFRLRKRSIAEELKDYENLNNLLCGAVLQNSKGNSSPEFTMEEMEVVLKELKTGKCIDPLGFVREMFIHGGETLTQSLLQMAHSLKRMKSVPVNWSKMCIQTLKKKTGSTRKLSSYRGIFFIPVLSIIFEKLLKNRITPHLEENLTQFQTGGVKGKGVADNLFILRGMIDHSKYLGKELWITFYDIEKCFDIYGWKIASIVYGDVGSKMTFCTWCSN